MNVPMGFLCKAVITDRVENFEVWEISAGDKKLDDVPKELKTAWLCRTDDNSLSWGKQPVNEFVEFGKVVKTGMDADGLVPGEKKILNRANYCEALLSMPAGNQLAHSSGQTQGCVTPTEVYFNFLSEIFLTDFNTGRQLMLAETINPYLDPLP